MKRLKGKITAINSHEGLSLIEVEVFDSALKTIIIGHPDDYSYLYLQNEVELLFKETEVILAKESSTQISLQNRLECTVKSIKKGVLLSQIELDFKGFSISSIITTNSAERLSIKEDESITAMIKTNEILISEC